MLASKISHISHLVLFVLLLAILTACNSGAEDKPTATPEASPTATQTVVAPPEAEETPTPVVDEYAENLRCHLIDVAGEIELYSGGVGTATIVTTASPVQCGDGILVTAGSSAKLMCTGDENPLPLTAGMIHYVDCMTDERIGVTCTEGGCYSVYIASLGFPTPGGIGGPDRQELEGIPYIIAPRATFLLEQPQTLRWQAIDGATVYRVVVLGPSYRWETTTTENELSFTGPPLEYGTDYGFEVTATVVDSDGNRSLVSSADEGVTDIGFLLLPPEAVSALQNELAAIDVFSLPASDQAIVEYDIYLAYGLNAEALDVLDTAIQLEPDLAPLYELQGEVFGDIALVNESILSYVTAIDVASGIGDLSVIGRSNAIVGSQLCIIGNSADSQTYFNDAIETYSVLGDNDEVVRLEAELELCQP